MDRIFDIINKFSPPRITIPLILHIVILSGILQIGNLEKLVPTNLQPLNAKIPMLTIATTAILLYLMLLASYILLCFKIRKNLKPKFGVLWDKNNEPYCPIHEKSLTRHTVQLNGKIEAGLDCTKCNKSVPLITDEGKRITLTEAKKLL